MDNRIFNVNGKSDKQLLAAIKLVFAQQSNRDDACSAWKVTGRGLVLLWSTSCVDSTPFMGDVSAEDVMPMVKKWLRSDEAKAIACEDWDKNLGHDGHNTIGWRVFCEDWGMVDGEEYAICAIKPAYMWHGK